MESGQGPGPGKNRERMPEYLARGHQSTRRTPQPAPAVGYVWAACEKRVCQRSRVRKETQKRTYLAPLPAEA
ncbi:hypothetical protein BHE90_008252 [Fusarium euwallaceae]|uniref:Uncharacterized protein n=4 Tax=Fusarium solani species complex TaxID=232080 RepID=A0A3M2S512_9HYPO|nr:hypothetical protein CDV36_007691 [Fusarium kuroshium]RSL79855.1 hypothetical protein CEP51_007019 [Fusarium floridanum]RSM03870.1 hypothetical protein CDV31_010270 [Fusarium ambrosium]RTE77252.1 hypothetical protein BHE90_008252 [Fusarium euwallaceae]